MALSQPAPQSPSALPARLRRPATIPSRPSLLARARSSALRGAASRLLPSAVLFTNGRREPSRPRVALTFDDGPDAMSTRYLDALARLGVRATFFLVGENAARAPGIVREYARRGHEVGAHGWSHEDFAGMSRERLADELARTAAALPPPRRRPMVRPPFGRLSPVSLYRLATAGYTTVHWSVDSDDCRTMDARTVERRLAPERLSPGDVVLMHEQQPWTLEALPAVVHALRGAGWELVTVGELME
jgi:peptidoglycan/xylan/chitin deacetylase (PgdA/CDA1 family)